MDARTLLIACPPPWRIALLVDPLTAMVNSARHARGLSRELMRRGHEVRAFGAPPGLLQEQLPPRAGEDLPRVKVGASVLSFRPDALIAYDSLSPAAWLGARIARRLRVPLVLVEPGAWREGKGLQRALWRVGESLWGPFVRRTAGAVLALDARSRQTALERGFAPGRVALVPHGVDVERFRPGLASEELARHRVRGRILTYTGPLEGRAELEHLIAAFARTVGQRGDWSLVFASEDPSVRLRACAQRLGVGARTHFLPLDDAELPALLASSTLFAQPSVESPGAVLALARAMACGLTVLAADTDESRGVIEPGETGLLAERDDIEAWTALLRRSASSPETRRRLALAARRAAEQRWAWPIVAAEFERAIAAARAPVAAPRQLELDSAPEATH